jgi:hypothetical protein
LPLLLPLQCVVVGKDEVEPEDAVVELVEEEDLHYLEVEVVSLVVVYLGLFLPLTIMDLVPVLVAVEAPVECVMFPLLKTTT